MPQNRLNLLYIQSSLEWYFRFAPEALRRRHKSREPTAYSLLRADFLSIFYESTRSGSLLAGELFNSMRYCLKCLIKATDFSCKFEKRKPDCHRRQKAKVWAVSSVVALSKVCWVTYSFQEQLLEPVCLWCTVFYFFPFSMGQRKLSWTSYVVAPVASPTLEGNEVRQSYSCTAAGAQIEKCFQGQKESLPTVWTRGQAG